MHMIDPCNSFWEKKTKGRKSQSSARRFKGRYRYPEWPASSHCQCSPNRVSLEDGKRVHTNPLALPFSASRNSPSQLAHRSGPRTGQARALCVHTVPTDTDQGQGDVTAKAATLFFISIARSRRRTSRLGICQPPEPISQCMAFDTRTTCATICSAQRPVRPGEQMSRVWHLRVRGHASDLVTVLFFVRRMLHIARCQKMMARILDMAVTSQSASSLSFYKPYLEPTKPHHMLERRLASSTIPHPSPRGQDGQDRQEQDSLLCRNLSGDGGCL